MRKSPPEWSERRPGGFFAVFERRPAPGSERRAASRDSGADLFVGAEGGFRHPAVHPPPAGRNLYSKLVHVGKSGVWGVKNYFFGRVSGLKRSGNVIYLISGRDFGPVSGIGTAVRGSINEGDSNRWRQSNAAAHANRTRRWHPWPVGGPVPASWGMNWRRIRPDAGRERRVRGSCAAYTVSFFLGALVPGGPDRDSEYDSPMRYDLSFRLHRAGSGRSGVPRVFCVGMRRHFGGIMRESRRLEDMPCHPCGLPSGFTSGRFSQKRRDRACFLEKKVYSNTIRMIWGSSSVG